MIIHGLPAAHPRILVASNADFRRCDLVKVIEGPGNLCTLGPDIRDHLTFRELA
jgi:hypothetical protein